MLFLSLSAFFIHLFAALSDPFLNCWDEQFHALVAKNMAANPFVPMLMTDPVISFDYKNWSYNHIWLHKPPLFLWQMAASIKLFGPEIFAVRLPSVIMLSIMPLFVYKIGKLVFDRNTGYLSACLTAFLFYNLQLVSGYQSTDHNDVSFMFYTTASCWAWLEWKEKNQWLFIVLIGLFSGCAVLCKWLGGLLVFGPWLLIEIMTIFRRGVIVFPFPTLSSLLVSLIVFLPWQVYIQMEFPSEATHEAELNRNHLFQSVEQHSGDLFFHFKNFKEIYGSAFFIPLLFALGFLNFFQARKTEFGIFSALVVCIVYLVFSVAATKMLSFTLPAQPFLIIGFCKLIIEFLNVLSQWMAKFIRTNLLTVLHSLSVVVISFSVLRFNKFTKSHSVNDPYWKVRYENLEFYRNFNDEGKRVFLFNAFPRVTFGYVQFAFFTGHPAIGFIPESFTIEDVIKKGYTPAVVDNYKLPKHIINDKRVWIYNEKGIRIPH